MRPASTSKKNNVFATTARLAERMIVDNKSLSLSLSLSLSPSLNRPILCKLKHETSIGGGDLINEFEFSVGELVGGEREFAAGAATDKKGTARTGKLVFHDSNLFSALADLGALCENAGLEPTPVVKTRDTADLPPLGLDQVLVENSGRIAIAKKDPQPLHWYQQLLSAEETKPSASSTRGDVSQPTSPLAATPAKPTVVARRGTTKDSSPAPTEDGTGSVRSTSKDKQRESLSKIPGVASMKHAKKAPSSGGGPEKGTLSMRRKVRADGTESPK
jgi:hypothetical protein